MSTSTRLKEQTGAAFRSRPRRRAGALGPADDDAPAGRRPRRAESLGTLARISHEMFVADETGRLLEAPPQSSTAPGSPDPDRRRSPGRGSPAVNGRRRDGSPPSLAAELARAASVGQEAWVAARGDIRLRRLCAVPASTTSSSRAATSSVIRRRDFDCAYDALLDDYEPRMPTTAVAALFDELKAELVPLIAQVAAAAPVDDSPLHARFPVDGQRHLVDEVVGLMGFDRQSSGGSTTPCIRSRSSVGAGDVRITTRWDENFFPTGLYGAMHECGHGLYEAGIAPVAAAHPARRPPSRWACTSHRAACGRTWSGAAARSAGVLAPAGRRAGRR